MKLLPFLLALPLFAASPVVYFSDLESGPKTGGENNNGVYVRIYGQNFGATQSTSTVTIGGGAVLVKDWNTPVMQTAGDRPLDVMTVQLGASAATGAIVVTVGGIGSTCINRELSNSCNFTVRSGNIYFVATTGNDANDGSLAHPWLTLIHARFATAAGDTVYARQGVDANTNDDFSACFNPNNQGGTAGNPRAIVAYPGETATIGTNTPSSMGGCDFGIRTHNGNTAESYWTFAEMNILGTFAIASSGGGGASRVTNWRFIGNDISCPTGTGAAGCYGAGNNDHIYLYGNNFHDLGVGPSASSLYQGVYFGDVSNHLYLAWNTIKNVAGCRAIQTNSSTNGDALYDIAIHDNSIHDARCDGMVLVSLDPTQGDGIRIYNNLIYNVGTGNMTGGGGAWNCVNAQDYGPNGGSGSFEVYYNTLYGCGTNPSPTFDPASGGFDMIGGTGNANKHLHWVNNILQMTTGPVDLYYWAEDNGSGGSCPSNDCGRIIGTNNLMFGLSLPVNNTTITGTINLNPLFTNPGSGDFSLQMSSPALAAGTPVAATLYDFNGSLRNASTPNIGAFESSSGGGSVATPVISPSAGSYLSAQTISFSLPTVGSTGCFTLDGSTPTASTAGVCDLGVMIYTAPFLVSSTTTVKTLGTKSGLANSSVATSVFTITSSAAMPVASPVGGSFSSPLTVTWSTTTPGALICITTDGSTPAAAIPGSCSHGSQYTGALLISVTTTAKALATAVGLTNSPVASVTYSLVVPGGILLSGKIAIAGGVAISGRRGPAAAPTFVQGCGNFLTGGQASITATCGSNFIAGHFLYICESNLGSAGTIAWSGDSGTFTPDPGSGTPITNFSFHSLTATCVYVPVVTGGGNSITATSGSLDYPSITVVESTAGTFDKADSGVDLNAGVPVQSNAVTPTNNGSFLFGIIMGNNSPVITPGTSVAWQSGATNTSTALMEYFSQTTAASVMADATFDAPQTAFAHIFVIH